MSAAVTAPRRQRVPYDPHEFQILHDSVGRLDYTPAFNPALECLIRNQQRKVRERLLPLIMMKAWGNQKRFAVHTDARTTPFTEADAGRFFGVARQTINELCDRLEEECLLRREDGRLYPIADPDAERERRKAESVRDGSDTTSLNIRLFRTAWFEAHPDAAEQYKKAFAVVDRIKKEIKREFRRQRSSGTAPQNGSARQERSRHDVGDGPDTTSGPDVTETAASFRTSYQPNYESASSSFPLPATAFHERAPEVDDDAIAQLVQNCRQVQADATDEEIAHFTRGKKIGRSVGNPVGFLLTAVPKMFASPAFHAMRNATIYARTNTEQEASQMERWRREQEESLADPNVSDKEKELIRLCLGLAPSERKPTESAAHSKAQKAGHA